MRHGGGLRTWLLDEAAQAGGRSTRLRPGTHLGCRGSTCPSARCGSTPSFLQGTPRSARRLRACAPLALVAAFAHVVSFSLLAPGALSSPRVHACTRHDDLPRSSDCQMAACGATVSRRRVGASIPHGVRRSRCVEELGIAKPHPPRRGAGTQSDDSDCRFHVRSKRGMTVMKRESVCVTSNCPSPWT